MNKPKGYDETSASSGFTPLREGGHVLVIREVEETKSKAGKDMIIVRYDTAPEDAQPKYYEALYKADEARAAERGKPATWRGRMYILVHDENGNTSRSFKTFTTSVEESNEGFVTAWGDKFGLQFVGKRIGGIAGKVLDAYEGREIHKTEIRFFRSVEGALSASIPDEYVTKNHKEQFGGAPIASSDFMQISDSELEELPFA